MVSLFERIVNLCKGICSCKKQEEDPTKKLSDFTNQMIKKNWEMIDEMNKNRGKL